MATLTPPNTAVWMGFACRFFGQLQEVVEGYGTKIIDYENNLDKLNRKLETERIKYKDIMDNIKNIKTSKSN